MLPCGLCYGLSDFGLGEVIHTIFLWLIWIILPQCTISTIHFGRNCNIYDIAQSLEPSILGGLKLDSIFMANCSTHQGRKNLIYLQSDDQQLTFQEPSSTLDWPCSSSCTVGLHGWGSVAGRPAECVSPQRPCHNDSTILNWPQSLAQGSRSSLLAF